MLNSKLVFVTSLTIAHKLIMIHWIVLSYWPICAKYFCNPISICETQLQCMWNIWREVILSEARAYQADKTELDSSAWNAFAKFKPGFDPFLHTCLCEGFNIYAASKSRKVKKKQLAGMKVGRASDNHTYSSPPPITPANAFRPQQKLQIYAHSASPIFATKHFPRR